MHPHCPHCASLPGNLRVFDYSNFGRRLTRVCHYLPLFDGVAGQALWPRQAGDERDGPAALLPDVRRGTGCRWRRASALLPMAHAMFPPPWAVATTLPITTATSPKLEVLHWLVLPTPLTDTLLALADPAPDSVVAASPAIVDADQAGRHRAGSGWSAAG